MAQNYLLGLLAEECGEVCQFVGKALRFGLETSGEYHGETKTSRELIELELGDVLAAIRFAAEHGLIDSRALHRAADAKYRKLTDPAAKNNMGRPLAPSLPPNVERYVPWPAPPSIG